MGFGVHEGMVQEALMAQKEQGGQIGSIMIQLGHLTESQLLLALGKQAGLEVVDLRDDPCDPQLVAKLDESMAEMFGVVPWRMDGEKMLLAIANHLLQTNQYDRAFMERWVDWQA